MLITKNQTGGLVYRFDKYSPGDITDAVCTSEISSTNTLYIETTVYSSTAATGMVAPLYVKLETKPGVINVFFFNSSNVKVGELHINISPDSVASKLRIDAMVDRISTKLNPDKLGLGGLRVNSGRIILTLDSDGTYSAYYGSGWKSYTDPSVIIGDLPIILSTVSEQDVSNLQSQTDSNTADIAAIKPLLSGAKSYYVSR